MSVRDIQFRKASHDILSNVEGRVTFFRFLQPVNMLLAMYSIPSPITASVI